MKKNQWEKNFRKFSKKFNFVKFFGEYNIEKYLNDLNKDTKILDFGCGKGKILEFLKKKKI